MACSCGKIAEFCRPDKHFWAVFISGNVAFNPFLLLHSSYLAREYRDLSVEKVEAFTTGLPRKRIELVKTLSIYATSNKAVELTQSNWDRVMLEKPHFNNATHPTRSLEVKQLSRTCVMTLYINEIRTWASQDKILFDAVQEAVLKARVRRADAVLAHYAKKKQMTDSTSSEGQKVAKKKMKFATTTTNRSVVVPALPDSLPGPLPHNQGTEPHNQGPECTLPVIAAMIETETTDQPKNDLVAFLDALDKEHRPVQSEFEVRLHINCIYVYIYDTCIYAKKK